MSYKRDYKREAAMESEARKERRNFITRERRRLIREGKLRIGDGKQVDHIKPMASGGKNSRSNLQIVDANANMRKQPNRKGAHKGTVDAKYRIKGRKVT
jgi:5-methylcytosine-specific restriction endonuclease McrA